MLKVWWVYEEIQKFWNLGERVRTERGGSNKNAISGPGC